MNAAATTSVPPGYAVALCAALTLALPACEGLLGCTEVGCGDSLVIQLAGVNPEEEFTLTLHADGEDPIVLDCDPVGGECFGPYLSYQEFNPDEVTLVLELADTTISRTFEPHYRTSYPNGRFCGPECRSAEITFEVE